MKLRQPARQPSSAEASLVSRDRFILAFEHTPIGISFVNADGQFLYANKAYLKMNGYRLSELRQLSFSQITHPDDLKLTINNFNKLRRGKITDYAIEKRNIRKDGSAYWVKTTVSRVLDEAGNIVHFVTLSDDITDQVQARDDLKASEQRFRQLADSMPQIVWTAEADGRAIYYNQQWYDYTGFKRGKALTSWRKLLHPEDLQYSYETWANSVAKGLPYQIEYRFRDRHIPGRYRWFLGKAVPVRDNDGQVVKWFGSLTDIDDVKQALKRRNELEETTTRLAHQKNELMALNTAKDEFISLASHQLRTPATGVKQYIGLLLSGMAGVLEPEQLHMLRVANDANNRQLKIIDDLLKVARADAGKIELNKSECNLVELLYAVIQEQLTTYHDRHQSLVFNDPPAEILAVVDVKLIRMVLENIIDNASKYSPEGKAVTVEIQEMRDNVLIRIRDEGVGIKKADQANLFLKFSRIDNILSTLVGGTGLGLYWSKKIVDLHRGTIDVVSRARRGTTFIICLPLRG